MHSVSNLITINTFKRSQIESGIDFCRESAFGSCGNFQRARVSDQNCIEFTVGDVELTHKLSGKGTGVVSLNDEVLCAIASERVDDCVLFDFDSTKELAGGLTDSELSAKVTTDGVHLSANSEVESPSAGTDFMSLSQAEVLNSDGAVSFATTKVTIS